MKILPLITSAIVVNLTISSQPLLAQGEPIFSCSAEGVLVEVHKISNGTLVYKAYNIPTTYQKPDLQITGGKASKNQQGDIVYRFKNKNYLYAVVQPNSDRGGYGEVLIYKNNKKIGTKYCGDV